MADGFLDKVLELITKSDRIGFALLFAGIVIFAGWHHQLEPFTYLSKEYLGLILFASLAGAGLVIFRVSAWLLAGTKKALVAARNRYADWKKRRTAPDRLSELLPDEIRALVWMLVNDNMRIYGNRLRQAFEGLIRKGFLSTTDGRELEQVFVLNPRIEAASKEILAKFPQKVRDAFDGENPPWQQRMRI
jgi:hypothetical protein